MKLIQLTKGLSCQVSDEDFEWLNQWKWYAGNGGALRRPTKYGRLISMSRLILGLPDDIKFLPDHIDRNPFNNQRSNLRIATRSQNNANKKCIGGSGYLGVFPAGKSGWFARINKNGTRYYLGFYKVKEQAAMAYNIAAVKIHGEFANLNVLPCR